MNAVKKLIHFLDFAGREFTRPINYIMAFIIGAVINIGMGHDIFTSFVPYAVPILVQAFSKASVNYRNRDMDLLLALPRERKDPAFVMDKSGLIIASTGNSTEFFKRHKIKSLDYLFDDKDVTAVLQTVNKDGEELPAVETFELYSDLLHVWYQVQLKVDHKLNHVLVWLEEITQRKELDQRLSLVRLFSGEIMTSIKDVAKENDIYDRLATLILQDGYRGVFLAREIQSGDMAGLVSKTEDGMLVKSGLIEIPKSSLAPVLDSRKLNRVVSVSKRKSESQEEFDKAHPLDARVREFLGFPIENFVNYHEADVSVIAFNRENGIRRQDLSVMETMVNTVRSTTYLTNLSIVNEEKFLQIITGLAAASEYSDELTGKHILRVNEYSRLLATHLGFSEEFSGYIGQVASLHDIGKVAIPDIIKLERKLTDSEFVEMRMHPVYGAQIVEQMISQGTFTDARLIMARNIALNHHQQWDGKGYPGLLDDEERIVQLHSRSSSDYSTLKPLEGDKIPIEALIVSLSDKYDALRSKRQYKPAFSHEKTTAILMKDDRTGSSGEDVFGPEITELYLDIQKEFEKIFDEMRDP